MPFELYLALRYLRFHRGRTFLSLITLISVVGVAVGTAALVVALSLNAGFVEDIRERIHSGSAHLTVMAVDEDSFADVEALVRRVEGVPGVRSAGAVLYTPAMLLAAAGGSSSFSELQGVESDRHARVMVRRDGDGDPFRPLAGPTDSGREGIVLGWNLALRAGLAEGDLVRVMVPQVTLTPWAPQPRSAVFEVVGTYRSEHFQQDSQRAYVALEAARRLLRAEGRASWIEVRLDDPRALHPMKQALREALGPGWYVIDLIEQNRDLLRALNTEKLALFLAIGLIVVVAALNIVSTLILMVTDKVKEIGTLTAMGTRPVSIARVFVLQGFVIGTTGTVLGLTLGAAASYLLDRFQVIRLNPDVYYLTHLPFSVRPSDLVFVGCSALAVSLLATIYPASKAAGLDPVEALRHE